MRAYRMAGRNAEIDTERNGKDITLHLSWRTVVNWLISRSTNTGSQKTRGGLDPGPLLWCQ